MDSLIRHTDVTTIMRLLGQVQADVRRVRTLLENEDGEEEAFEDDS